MPDTKHVTDGLNALLADATVFYQKLRHYHWNVTGRHFFELHVKLEELYTAWAVSIDEIAERILMIEGVPLHTLASMIEAASLQEDETIPAATDMVSAVISDLRALRGRADEIIGVAEAAGDRGTVNLLDAVRDDIDKDLWMLVSWQKEGARAWS
jgi:starvation-inducible DNA-binding protein